MPDELEAVVEPKRRGRPPKVHPEPSEEMTLAEWEAQEPCPHCHARPNRHPLTGIWVRSWDAATRSFIDGHRSSCLTLAKKP